MKQFILIIFYLLLVTSISAQTKPVTEINHNSEKVDALVREQMAANQIPGVSLAIIRNGFAHRIKMFFRELPTLSSAVC